MPVENHTQQQPTRIPPSAPDIERKILASMLIEPTATAQAIGSLQASDFYVPAHRTIFHEMQTLFHQGKTPGMVLVESSLSASGQLSALGGSNFLIDLLTEAGATSSIEELCGYVKQKSIARQLIARFTTAIEQAYDPTTDVGQLLKKSESFLYSALTGQTSGRIESIAEVATAAVHEIERIHQEGRSITGLETGMPFDETLSGLQKQKLYVLAARPGMGKTAFMLQICSSVSKTGHRVGILSLEMGNRSLANRLLMADARVDAQRARTGKLTTSEITALKRSAERFQQMGIYLDDSTDLTPALLRVKARMLKSQHKVDLIAIDYLQLMRGDAEKQSREQEVSELSRTCKLISKELDIPVIILAQLSRKPEERRGFGKRPQNGDLRESGAIEQDADVVMMLFRPEVYGLEVYDDGRSTKNICEVIITKHRDGPTGLKKMIFDSSAMRFLTYLPEPQGAPIPPIALPYKDEDPF